MKKTNESNNINTTFKGKTVSNILKTLLKNDSIKEDEYNYLSKHIEKKVVLNTISMITHREIKSIAFELEDKKIYVNNLTSGIKKRIQEVVNEENLIIESKAYHEVAENKATNSIVKIIAQKHKKNDFDFLGNLDLKIDESRIKIQGLNKPKTSTSKFLDFLMMSYVANGRSKDTMKIHINEYLKLKGKKDTPSNKKEIRKEINEALNVIQTISISFTSEKKKNYLNMALNGGTCGITNSIIYFNFNNDFIEYMNEIPKQFMYIHKEIFKFNDKYNPHSYYLLRRACLHKRMNLGKSNENIINAKTLLTSCPKFDNYKNYENSTKKDFTQKILEPFERDMDNITAFSWQYTKGQPTNYELLNKSSIELHWNDYPKIENINKKNNKITKKLGG